MPAEQETRIPPVAGAHRTCRNLASIIFLDLCMGPGGTTSNSAVAFGLLLSIIEATPA